MTTPEPTPTPERKERRVRLLLDRALSASAGTVAVTALAVSMYQAWISREQQKMSAWPYVTQSNTGGTDYGRLVQNVGLGPALVRSAQLDVDGRPVRNWAGLLTAVYGGDTAATQARLRGVGTTTSSVSRGMVLLPGSTTVLLRVAPSEFARDVRRFFDDSARVDLRFCYCSLYGDCWVSSSRADEPKEVRACPDDPAREFRS